MVEHVRLEGREVLEVRDRAVLLYDVGDERLVVDDVREEALVVDEVGDEVLVAEDVRDEVLVVRGVRDDVHDVLVVGDEIAVLYPVGGPVHYLDGLLPGDVLHCLRPVRHPGGVAQHVPKRHIDKFRAVLAGLVAREEEVLVAALCVLARKELGEDRARSGGIRPAVEREGARRDRAVVGVRRGRHVVGNGERAELLPLPERLGARRRLHRDIRPLVARKRSVGG